jgi:hypothetical protein
MTCPCHCEAASAAEAISSRASRMLFFFVWNLRLLRRLWRLAPSGRGPQGRGLGASIFGAWRNDGGGQAVTGEDT